jgi:predicted TIM-barrel fold metal-dependent hydrolase
MVGLVDAHVHLIEPAVPGLGYKFATTRHAIFGGVVAPPEEPPWTAQRLVAEPSDPPVSKRVHVQCADVSTDPVLETRFVADRAVDAAIHAIVARTPLAEPGFQELLERHLEASDLVRGVRDMTAAERLDEPAVTAALAVLAQRGLSWDAQCAVAQLPRVTALARRHPDLQIVLTHAALPVARAAEDLPGWRAAITALAAAPNVCCKLSGFGIGDHDWTVASLRPWVLGAVEAFGPQRCMFGSNWPVDRLFSSYQALLDAHREILGELSDAERTAIFAATATRVYKL